MRAITPKYDDPDLKAFIEARSKGVSLFVVDMAAKGELSLLLSVPVHPSNQAGVS